jgi:hypothetical protein
MYLSYGFNFVQGMLRAFADAMAYEVSTFGLVCLMLQNRVRKWLKRITDFHRGIGYSESPQATLCPNENRRDILSKLLFQIQPPR